MYKLAEESGLTQSTITNMFARGTIPSIATLSRICDAFKISLSDFFCEEDKVRYLSKSESVLIRNFRMLNQNEKQAVNVMIKSLINK